MRAISVARRAGALAVGLVLALTTAGTTRADERDDEAVREVVTRYFRAMEAQDLKALGDCLGKSFATPQAPNREAFLARMKGSFDRLAPTKFEVKVKSLRREPTGTVVARVEFRGKARLKGGKDAIDDEGDWAMLVAREGGTWKLTGIMDAYLEVAHRVLRAKTRAERVALLRAEGDEFLKDPFLQKIFEEQAQLTEAGDFPTAERLQELAEAAAEAITDPDDRILYRGLTLLGRGKGDQMQARFDEAVKAYREALALFREKGWKTFEVSLMINLGAAQTQQGDFQGAVKTLEEARTMLAGFNELAKAVNEAMLLGNLGQVYTELGEYTKAVKHLEDSLRLAEKGGNAVAVRNARLNLAAVRLRQGRPAEAIRAYEDMLAPAQKAGQRFAESQILNNLALALAEHGRNADAERRFGQARKLAVDLNNPRSEAITLFNLALLRFKLGADEDAGRYNDEALKLYRKVGDRAGIARCLRLQGLIHIGTKRQADAVKAFEECVALVKEGGSRSEIAQTDLAAAAFHIRIGNAKKAKEFLTSAEDAYRRMGDRYTATFIRYKKSLFMTPDGVLHHDPAELFGAELDILKLNDPWLMRLHHEDKGFAHFVLGEWRHAATEFEAAIRIMEQRVAGVEDPLLRASFGATYGSQALPFMYIALAVTRAEQGDPEGVFRTTERAKARVLTGLLDRTPGAVRKGLTAREADEEGRLREAVAAATKQLHSAIRFASDEPGRRERVAKELHDAQSRYEEYRRQLSLAHPELRGRLGDLPPPDLIGLQKSLFADHPDAAVVSYVAGWDRVLIAVVTAGEKPDGPARVTVRSVKVPYNRLEQAAEELKSGCLNPQGGTPVSDDLWDWLIAPAEQDLAGKKHLVVVPSAPLMALPFQALRKGGGPYLIQQYALSYAPSVGALVEMRRQTDRRKGRAETVPVVAVGGVNFTRDLKPLPASRPEAEAIGRLFGDRGRVLLGDRATRSEVVKHAGSARFLHLATHGLVNESRPLFSALAVTPTGGDDGRLYAHDVMNLDLSAELVVLSACETARGREYRGEGTVGLAWAFFVAGAPAVVVSQWPVVDATTADLMQKFYGRVRAGTDPSKAESLRQAQLELLKDRKTRHPFFWAPFVLVGDWRK
jgi:CHAT domain-containing protein